MAGSKATFWEDEVLRIACGQSPTITGLSGTITPYLSLHTGAAGEDGPGTEVTGGGYARVDTSGKWATPSGGSVSNDEVISFTQASGSWSGGAALTHFAIWDAASGGNCLYWGDLSDPSKTVGASDTISFQSGALVIQEG